CEEGPECAVDEMAGRQIPRRHPGVGEDDFLDPLRVVNERQYRDARVGEVGWRRTHREYDSVAAWQELRPTMGQLPWRQVRQWGGCPADVRHEREVRPGVERRDDLAVFVPRAAPGGWRVTENDRIGIDQPHLLQLSASEEAHRRAVGREERRIGAVSS